jgi:hypothetical protein
MTAYAAKIIISYSFIAGMQWLDLGSFSLPIDYLTASGASQDHCNG